MGKGLRGERGYRLVPPSFSRKLKETNGVLGSSVLLECKVSGTSPISVAWFQDGNEIVSGEKYEISFLDNICALKLNALDATDTGPYTCVAANVAGSDECSAFLTSIVLESSYVGTPPISVTWKRNGTPIAQSPRCSVTTTDKSGILEIFNSIKSDEGEYTCEVANEAGADVCHSLVSILGARYP
uniref:Ig-like domain-containing protein n=1 Tax=Dromaius novaehollandiae TaxID=8790 RepID=A0A8C4KP82_DRONO